MWPQAMLVRCLKIHDNRNCSRNRVFPVFLRFLPLEGILLHTLPRDMLISDRTFVF